MNIRAIFSSILLVFAFSFSASAAEQVFFYHTDPAGTPLVMTNSSGAVVWKADYKPFGEENSITGAGVNDRRFVGKEKDEETGLSYFGARYEDAKTGRFIAVDPVGAVDAKSSKTNEKMLLNPQRLNAYAYALNNPYRYVDPDGREVVTLAILANLLFGGTANAPEYRYSPTVGSQTTAEFAGGVALAETGGLVVGRVLGAAFSRKILGTGKSFFEGTKYTNKVMAQMRKGDFHAFPESVKAFESDGIITTIKGGDGGYRQLLKIPGEYGGKKGSFEFIKEANGEINHRLFRPSFGE